MCITDKIMIGILLSLIIYLILMGSAAIDYERDESVKKMIDSAASSITNSVGFTLGIYSICAMITIIPILILL